MTWRYLGEVPDAAPLPRRLLRVLRHRALLRTMAERDLRMRYGGATLGLLWAIVHPLLLVALYVGIFTVVLRARLVPDAPVEQYALYVVAGLLPWMAVAGVAGRAAEVMAEHRALVKQVVFPVEILPLHGILPALLAQLIGTCALVALVWLRSAQLSPWMLALPLVLAAQVAMMAGLAWALGTLAVALPDVKEAVQVLLTLGMFLTPIFYVESILPQYARLALNLNPMAHLIYVYRDVLIDGRLQHPISAIVLAVLAPLSLLAGFAVFDRMRSFISDNL